MARELGAAGLTTAALDAWRASINKPPMAQLTDVQVRQIVGLVLGSDLREKVRGFMGDAAQGAEG